MRRKLARTFLAALLALAATVIGVRMAWAVSAFRNQFIARYVKPDSKDPKDRAFAEMVDKAKCFICHVGTSKKNRNAYGQALDKLLDRKKDAGNKEKIQKALGIVEKMKINPKDPKSPTFGDRIRAGLLPVPLPPEPKEK